MTYISSYKDQDWLLPTSIKQMIKPYKNMKYLGPIRGKEKIAEMYQAADIYVLPSYREGLPLTLFEAMASGLPIIASPVNGIPFEMKENENGLFSEYSDISSLAKNIQKLIDNPDLRKRFSLNNKKKAKNYDWDTISGKYLKQYKSLLIEKKSTAFTGCPIINKI